MNLGGRLRLEITTGALYVELMIDEGSTNRISDKGIIFYVLISMPMCQT